MSASHTLASHVPFYSGCAHLGIFFCLFLKTNITMAHADACTEKIYLPLKADNRDEFFK